MVNELNIKISTKIKVLYPKSSSSVAYNWLGRNLIANYSLSKLIVTMLIHTNCFNSISKKDNILESFFIKSQVEIGLVHLTKLCNIS